MNLTVYVPSVDGPLDALIDRGSGIVGSPDASPDHVRIDFEGNRYGAANIITFADKVAHAAGRHETHYPTVARAFVPREHLIAVGQFDGDRVEVGDSEALTDWLGDYTDDDLRITAHRRIS